MWFIHSNHPIQWQRSMQEEKKSIFSNGLMFPSFHVDLDASECDRRNSLFTIQITDHLSFELWMPVNRIIEEMVCGLARPWPLPTDGFKNTVIQMENFQLTMRNFLYYFGRESFHLSSQSLSWRMVTPNAPVACVCCYRKLHDKTWIFINPSCFVLTHTYTRMHWDRQRERHNKHSQPYCSRRPYWDIISF